MMKVNTAIVLAALVAVASAHTTRFGRCNDKEPMQDFDTTQFAGKWYVLAASSTSSHCLTMNYTLRSDGNLGLEETRELAVIRMTDFDVLVRGQSVLKPSPDNSGRFETLEGTTGHTVLDEADTVILNTDYTTYAVLYECKNAFWIFKSEALIVLGRNLDNTNAIIDQAVEIAETKGISSTSIDSLSTISHLGCSAADEADFQADVGDLFGIFGGSKSDDGEVTYDEDEEELSPDLGINFNENPAENEVP